MQRTTDMGQGRTVRSRAFLLWVIATVLIAIAMWGPGYAIADDEGTLSQGVLTLDTVQENTSADVAEGSLAVTDDAIAITDSTVADSTLNANEASTGTAENGLTAETAQDATSNADITATPSEEEIAQNSAENDSTVAEGNQENDSYISNLNNNYNDDVATYDEPAQDSYIEDNASETVIASDNNATNQVEASTNIGNDPPANASTASNNDIAKATSNSSVKATDDVAIPAIKTASNIKTQSGSIEITFVLGGFYTDPSGSTVVDTTLPVPTINEIFTSYGFDGATFDEDSNYSGVDVIKRLSDALTGGTTGTYSFGGRTWPSITFHLGEDDVTLDDIYRLGYELDGGFVLLQYFEKNADFSSVDIQEGLYSGTFAEFELGMKFDKSWWDGSYSDLVDPDDEDGGLYVYKATLIPIWKANEEWSLDVYNDSATSSFLSLEDIAWFYETITLPTQSNSFADADGYEFAGYVIQTEYEDSDDFLTYDSDGYYYISDSSSHISGSIPVVAAGSYSFAKLYMAAIGNATGTNSVWYPSFPYYPGDLEYPSEGGPLYDKHLILRSAYKKKSTQTLSYTVNYYKTDADSKNGALAGTSPYTYTSAAANAETLSGLSITTPTAAGYDISFKGWATSAANAAAGTVAISSDGGSLSALSPANNGSYTLYAVWTKTAQTYTVTYNPNGFSGKNPVTETHNVADLSSDKAKTESAVWGSSRDGFTFNGWASSSSGTVYLNAGAALANAKDTNGNTPSKGSTVQLYAIWTSTQYTVNFKDSDGSTALNSSIMSTTTANYATSATSVAVPTGNKTGYTFGGWKLNNASGNVVAAANGTINTSNFTPTAGQTYTFAAIWNEIEYTINWLAEWGSVSTVTDTSGNTLSNSATSTVKYATNASTKLSGLTEKDSLIPSDSRVKSGGSTYEFIGWYVTKTETTWDKPATGVTALGDMTISQVLGTSGVTTAGNTVTIYGIWKLLGAATVSYRTNNKGGGSAGFHTDNPFTGDNYTVISSVPTDTGYTFTGWNTQPGGGGTAYKAGDVISNVQTMQLYAQWRENTVKFTLNANTSDSSVVLNANDASNVISTNSDTTKQFKVGDTVKESLLTSATPTRNGFEFKGWAKSASGGVIIGPSDSDATYPIAASDAPADDTNINLYAIWQELTYAVRYNANTGTDTANAVTFTAKTGGATKNSPYTWSAKTKRTDSGLDNPDINVSRDWYTFVGWGTTASATTGILNTDQLGTLYDNQTGATGRVLDLYAIWKAITFTVNYQAADSNGTVNPITETINLATDQASDITGSTATATATGYKLATPTWTDMAGNAVTGVSTTAAQAFYKPTITYLRTLYSSVPSTPSITFYAHFEEADWDYQIQAFLQKADGTWATSADITIDGIGSNDLKAKYGTTVSYTDTISGASIATLNGKALWQIALYAYTTQSITNNDLFDFDSTQGTLSFQVDAENRASLSKNILKLYYGRKTYELEAVFQSENAAGTKTAGAPSSVTTAPASYINGGSATTSLRWGESVTVGTPSATGYTFAWAVTTPAGASSTSPGTSFTLTAADMAKIANETSPKAVLTGTFTVIQYQITLNDTDANSTHNWPSSTSTAGPGLASSSRTDSTNVESDGTLGNWVPTPSDMTSYTYYFAGWRDDADSSIVVSSDTLKSMTNWTSNKSYTAVWLPKLLISYDPGDKDSAGNSKAAWAASSTSLNIDTSAPTSYLVSSTARFVTLVGSSFVDASGNPLGADGWEFDYWTIVGTNGKYGHINALTGYADAMPIFLEGTSGTDGIALNKSYSFVAHWKGKTQTVTVNNSGRAENNTSNTDTITATLPAVATSKTYVTDDVVDLSDYTPTSIPNGYTLAGWKWTYTNSAGATSTGTYALGSKFNVKIGTTVIDPVFNEKTVTFKYEVASGDATKGEINPTTSDTVFAVKHNGINDHTASSKNATAYEFVEWTYNSGTVTTDDVLTAAKMGISASEVLSADRTYYASFSTKQYKLRFAGAGTTDGTDSAGTVTAGGTGAALDNSFTVDWNTTIPSGGTVTVTAPEGYELDGWIVDGTGTPQVFSGGNASNNQGIYNYLVTGNHTLTAHFKESTAKNYTVNYSYDPDNISGFTGTEASRSVAWGEDVRPSNANNANPTQAGYTFDGWYIDSSYSQDIDAAGPEFGKIYTATSGTGKAITIYAKWTAKDFTVAYELYGNIPDDPSTANDDVTVNGGPVTSVTVGWNTLAGTFKLDDNRIKRAGYKLGGWTATVTKTEGGTIETSTNVLDSDTFGKLANNTDTNRTVTLHPIWTSENYTVLYDYNDASDKFSTHTPNKSETKGWAEVVDYYTLGAAPTHSGYKFNGWDVEYVGDAGSGTLATLNGTRITAAGNTTIRDIVNGDINAIGSTPIIKFIASWTAQSTYIFQDRLIHVDGTYQDEAATSSTTVDGNTIVYFTQYGTPKTSYDGYDFDNHVASNPNFLSATANQMTITEGTSQVFYVYYLERSYNIDFYTNETDSSGSFITNNNPWDSAAAALPTTTPTKAGYTFDGWYITDGTNEAKIDGTNTLASLTSVFTSAPANGSTLKAVGKWTQNSATIAWNSADANGTTSPAPGSATRNATDATAIPAITATPASSDYVFEKWTYSYTDATGATVSGDVSGTSPFATLSGTDGETLTPVQWAMSTGDSAVWHDITFTANFVLSSALKVTIEYYLEDGDNLGTYPTTPNDTETKHDAVDDATYTVTPKTFAGYTLNTGMSDLSHTYDYETPSTWVFKVYLNANAHTVTYKYVESDGTTVQTPPTGAAALSTFNGGTYYTGGTLTVDAAPTLSGYTFKGWFLSTNYGGTNVSGTSITLANDDIELVGTWELVQRHVNFINGSANDALGVTVTQTTGGYYVTDGLAVKTAVTPAASTLGDLNVVYNANGKTYTLTGWDVIVGGVTVDSNIGISDPLSRVITADTTFQAVWESTYRATYSHGDHGSFASQVSNQLQSGDPIPTYESLAGTSPVANNGWEFVGWGAKTNGNWSYYFNDEAGIDYGTTTGTNGVTMPANISNNIEFVAFYKAKDRTLVFSTHEYDSGVAVGTESAKDFSPAASFASGVTSSKTVKTGANETMLNVADVDRDGYTLVGWTDGTKTYTPGSANEFVMPEVADGTTVYLYPVFSFDQLTIGYDVASDSTGRGDVTRTSDTKSNSTDTVVGSAPVDKPGYEFDYWTKDSGTAHLTAAEGLQADGKTLIPTESGTYHAHFKEKSYDFTMDTNPGITGETLPATALPTGQHWTDSITLETPTRAGYTFAGWDVYESTDWTTNGTSGTKLHSAVAAGSTLVSALSDANGTATKLTLVPTWTAKSYEVKFNDGATSGTGAVSGMPGDRSNLEFTTSDIDTSAPSRVGYTFAGWTTSATGGATTAGTGIKYSDLANDDEDVMTVTLTATWTANAHTITYVAGTDDTWSTTASDYPSGDPAATTPADAANAINTATDAVITLRGVDSISHSGSVLIGWNDGTKDYLFANGDTTITIPNGDVTLTPIWQESGDYNVIFDAGTGVTDATMPSNRTNIKYTTDNIDTSAPTRAGYTFTGWTNSAGGVTTAGTGIKYSDLANGDDTIKTVTLTATWTAKNDYSVSFDKNAGSETVTQWPVDQTGLQWGDTVITKDAAGDPQRDGYIFAGWTIKDSDGNPLGGTDTLYYTGSSSAFSALAQNSDVAANKALTLMANWTAKTYEVEFVENKPAVASGTVAGMPTTNPITNLKYTDTGIVAPALTLDGYDFGGWTNSVTGSVIADGTYTYAALANNSDTNLKVVLTAVWTPKAHTVTYSIGSGDTWSTNASDYPTTEPAGNGATDPAKAIDTATDATIDLRGANSVTRPGSVLLGWSDGTNQYLFANGDTTLTVPDGNVTLAPVWQELGDYNVYYFTGDSTGATKVTAGTMPADQTGITYATTGISTAAPTRAGYTFAGWANDAGADVAAGTTTIDYATLVGNDSTKKTVNLTAKWTANEIYKVSYADGVPSGSIAFTGTLPADRTNIGFDADDVKQTELNVGGADRLGFTFTGWEVTNDADGSVLATITGGYAVDAVYSALVGGDSSITAITFTAKWAGTPYDVTYHLTDGSWVTGNITDGGAATPNAAISYKVEQSVATRAANTVTRDGYTLKGWANGTDSTATGYKEYLFGTDDSFSMPAANVDLYPLWTAKDYTVTFVDKPASDTGTTAVSSMPVADATYHYDSNVAHTEPVRSGYDFGGWDVYKTSEYTADAATATVLRHVGAGTTPYSTLSGDPDIDALTLVATWTAQSFGVTYILTDGEGTWVAANITDAGKSNPKALVGYVTDVTVDLRQADTVYRPGYTLAGWKDSNSPTVTPVEYLFDATTGAATLVMPAANVYLYPIWDRSTGYTVTFDPNAPTTNIAPGAVLGNVPVDQPVAPAVLTWDGTTGLVTTGVPTFTGYTFKGWTVYGSDNVVIGGTDASPLPGTDSYHFNVLAGNVDSATHKHLTLVANWEISNAYSVVFKDGVAAGETPVTAGTMPADQTGISFITVVDYTAPSRIGYTFDGWTAVDVTDPLNLGTPFDVAAGTNAYYVLASNNDAVKALELTAKWIVKKGYNVHFVDKPASDTGSTAVNMGGLVDLTNLEWDESFNAGPAPTRTGYTFERWEVTNTTNVSDVKSIGQATAGSYKYSDLAYDATTTLMDDTITDITLTAIWTANKHTVTYVITTGEGTWVKANIGDAGKNTPDDPITYSVDDTVTLRDASTLIRAGWELVGWTDDANPTNTYMLVTDTGFIMEDVDVKLYPVWNAKTYTVIFDENKPAGATDVSQVVSGMPTNPQTGLNWTSTVDTTNPTLVGYEFVGWVIEDASDTGALTGNLMDASYSFDTLAITDTAAHAMLKLIAQWKAASYRVTYVDRTDANGAALTTPVVITTDDTKLWGDNVSLDDPWTIVTPAYAGKSNDDWHFDGWQVLENIAGTDTYVLIGSADSTIYSVLAGRENLTVADVATTSETPALILYATWTRRVPFVVDYVKRPVAAGGTADAGLQVTESSETVMGLDGDDISVVWKDTVLDMGDAHKIAGYTYNRVDSEPNMAGVLSTSGGTIRLVLFYDQLLDYVVTYDATPGTNAAGNTSSTADSPAWETPGANFAPTDSDWTRTGYRIDHWTYGPNGTEFTFDASGNLTFADIAKAIYGTVDGSEGRDLDGDGVIDKPVTLHAVWVERTDYKVKYDDNYDSIENEKFLERTKTDTFTPEEKEDVAWSSDDITPSDADKIVKPGIDDGDKSVDLYEIDGWDYLNKGGKFTPVEGKSFSEIFEDIDPNEVTDDEITLYARWKEVLIELKYTPTLVTVDENGNVVSTGGNGGGTVSRTSETVSAVTGGTASGGSLTALGSSIVSVDPGYHFVGWRRVSTGEIVYAPGMDPATLSAMASGTAGYNVLPSDVSSLFAASQNSDDGYWHSEEYQALFAQNDIAILHYDKNATDATGSIADVEKPFGSLVDLSDGSPFKRSYWTLTSWNTAADGSGTTYTLGQTGYVLPEGETTLYAQWTRNKATLSYDGNGTDVTNVPASETDEWGTDHTVSSITPHRKHYTFLGWNTAADGSGTDYIAGDTLTLPGSGVTLYAQWKLNSYPVSIGTDEPTGGKVTTNGPISIEHGGHLPEGYYTATPSEGYHLSGWKYTLIDEDGNVITGTVSDPSLLPITGTVTFEPIFEADVVAEAQTAAAADGKAGVYGEHIVQTGDNDAFVMLVAALAAIFAALALIIARRRRESDEDAA